ncbi:MAG: efflux RND transporter periplasmic adaptor subunit [Desulfobacter sp.]|nr:MAG: efflux RND transporter periplasmic adaptor subunit [Desulfobacter sp.]
MEKHIPIKYIIMTTLALLFFPAAAMAAEQHPAMVKTATAVEQEQATRAKMTGTLYFERTSRVSPEEAGRAIQVNFMEGDRVSKGDILIRLDSRILQTELALQKARLAQAEIRIKKTKLNLDRYTELYRKDVATESGYDDLRLTLEEQQQERTALWQQAEILKIRLSKFIVTAPFDGIVLEKTAEVGEWVQPGTLLCRLGAVDSLFAEIPVAEHLMGFTREKERLEVTLNAFNRKISGIVEGIRPTADPKTKNVSLKIRLDYNESLSASMKKSIAENLSVTAMVPVSEPQKLIILPRDALVQQRGRDMIYTIIDNKAQPLPVDVRYSLGDRIGVAAQGLAPGMAVVIEGNERLRPDQPVMIQGRPKTQGETK